MQASGSPPRPQGLSQSFYPGVPELNAATPLTITPGQQVQADMRVKLTPVFPVSGNITGYTPSSGIGLQFATSSGDLAQSPMRFDEETGNFRTWAPGRDVSVESESANGRGRTVRDGSRT